MSKFTKIDWIPSKDGLTAFVFGSKGYVVCDFSDCLMFNGDKAEARANIRLICAAPEMYEFIASIAHLPDEQCMISPMIHDARKLIASIDGKETEE